MRLPPGSIRTWQEFRQIFLDYFFPSTKTNALRKEIQEARQDGDETLSEYWGRYKALLDACPNNRMVEADVYNTFYEGLTPESKDLVNSSSGGDFSKLKVSEAKRVLDRLINAKRAYDNPRTTILKRTPVNVYADTAEERMEARMDKMEKALLAAVEKQSQPPPQEKVNVVVTQEGMYPNYGPQGDPDIQAQVSAAGHYNSNGNWIPGKQRETPWRDHPNFRWSDQNQNQLPQPVNTYQQPLAITYQQPPAVTYQQPPAINYPSQLEGQPQWQNQNHEGQTIGIAIEGKGVNHIGKT